ncbi:MAG: HK97 family phage prohead protease [Bacteroidia bacterium]|nr:HK97 family phage prohead protease [Bacteroidia bacterium]
MRCNVCEFTIEDYKISGLAAPVNKLSKDIGGFREIIEPEAFYNVLESNPLVIAVVNHSRDAQDVLGSTESGTLQLIATERGLEFNLDVAKTSRGADIIELIKRDDVNKMSFSFVVKSDSWTPYGREMIRTIHEFETLTDISIVVNPAYDETEITV